MIILINNNVSGVLHNVSIQRHVIRSTHAALVRDFYFARFILILIIFNVRLNLYDISFMINN